MDPLLIMLNQRLDRADARVVAAAVAVLAVVLAALGAWASHLTVVQNVLGGIAGILLFVAGYIAVTRLLPEGWRERLDVRTLWPLPRRRMAVLWGVIAWFTVVFLIATNVTIPLTLLGAVNIAVLMMFWRVGSSTELERLMLEEDEQEWPEEYDEPGYDEDGAVER